MQILLYNHVQTHITIYSGNNKNLETIKITRSKIFIDNTTGPLTLYILKLENRWKSDY